MALFLTQLCHSLGDKAVTAELCYFMGFFAGLVKGCAGKGREREKIREPGLDGWEGALLVRTGGGAVGCSWRDADALQDLVFLSFLGVVFLLTISLENNEKLDLKVLLVLVNVSRVHSIARDVGRSFPGC